MNELLSIIWDVDPILIHFGDGGIRWYGLCWALGIYLCWIVNERMYKHEHCPAEWSDYLFFYMTAGVIIGARLGHCWFYEWHQYGEPWHLFGWEFTYRNPYIENPLRLLKIWEGGLSSHGGGIGLFRSEFLYLENSDFPSEEQQFEAYKNVLESMKGKKVIIRTLDIGADKKVDYFNLDDEENPAMGIRAIRICLTRPEIFKTQLRALFRASVYGDLGIMFPMITSESEISEIMGFCDIIKAELDTHGIPYADNIELGIMIETPAAAVISDKLAPMVDFFSVGTNDLTQYTLACDRQNPKIERFVDTHHEAVLRLIEMAAKAAHDNGKWIGICGELGADTSLTERFLRMGIDELSVSPPSVLKVRDKVRSIDLSK